MKRRVSANDVDVKDDLLTHNWKNMQTLFVALICGAPYEPKNPVKDRLKQLNTS